MSSSQPEVPKEKVATTTTGFSMNRVLLKAKYSLYSALVFFLFANPETTAILQRFFGGFATFLTLVLVPAMYYINERAKARIYGWMGKHYDPDTMLKPKGRE